ncbi:MAG: hypothetical protein ACYTG0_05065 [Planctomycetota bacterium]|jgi:hypothetical protein
MFTPLLGVRFSWVGILFILGGVAVVWLIIRAVVDLVAWFREEIVDEYRQGKQKRRKSDSERSNGI